MPAVQHFNKRLESLRTERSSFDGLWKELGDNILGYRTRFQVAKRNKGGKKNTSQYNNTAKRAHRTLQSGLMAGATSPGRPWFRLQTADPSLRELGPVKLWIESVEKLLYEIFAQSNFYQTLSQHYGDLGTFGTSPFAIYEDFENVIRCFSFPVGSYFLGNNGVGKIDTLYREYQLRASQLVSQFGIDSVRQSTRDNFERGDSEAWIDVVHAIEPNDDRDGASPLNTNMPFRSVYYEKTADQNEFLRESGFEEFPILTGRWDVTGEDIYATDCPGMTAIGDTKALQVLERNKAKAIDKLVDPPLQAPSAMKGRRVSLIPGDVSYIDANVPGQKIEPIYQVNPQLGDLHRDVELDEFRINSAYFVDLFLMFQNVGNRERVTAEEIVRKHEEKLLMLGPMYEREQQDVLDPAIDRTFNIALRAGIIPDPPPELSGAALKVEYISLLAQAQKMVAIQAIERTATFVGNMSGLFPSALDKLDVDQAIDEYAEAVGPPVQIIRSDDEVQQIRADQAQQAAIEQAAAMAEAAVPATEAVKNLASADTEGNNALTDILANVR